MDSGVLEELKEKNMSILVIAEIDSQTVTPATLATINAGSKLGNDIHVILMGHDLGSVSETTAKISGVTKVLVADHADLTHALAEPMTDVLMTVAKNYSHILAPSSTFGKNLLPRLAAQLDVGQLSDVIEIENESTFKRPIYAGNAIATVESKDPIKLLTIRATTFDTAEITGGSATIEKVDVPSLTLLSTYVGLEASKSDRPDLTSAKVVISGGRGLQNGENFKMIEELADKLNGAIGASRAAVDAGYVPNDYQVGQTGKVVAPDLYIAVGISGAIQHLAGMKDSKIIVAINNDEEAPIFQVADYGLVADLFEALPEFTKAI